VTGLAVLALKGVVCLGDHFGVGVGMFEGHYIDRGSRGRAQTGMGGCDAAPGEGVVEEFLEGGAQRGGFVGLGQHHFTLGPFAKPRLNATMRLPDVYIVVK
jgi:hypothetical protein